MASFCQTGATRGTGIHDYANVHIYLVHGYPAVGVLLSKQTEATHYSCRKMEEYQVLMSSEFIGLHFSREDSHPEWSGG